MRLTQEEKLETALRVAVDYLMSAQQPTQNVEQFLALVNIALNDPEQIQKWLKTYRRQTR